MKRFAVALISLMVAIVSPSFAGIGEGDGELGFDFGVASLDEDLGGEGAVHFKIRGGYLFSRLFEVEGQIGYSAHYDEGTLRSGHLGRADQQLRVLFINGIFNFHSSTGNVVPYVLGGIGTSTVDFPLTDVADTSVAWQTAAGSRFFFGDKDQVVFRLELALIFDDTFEQSNSHREYVAGFAWRLR